MLEFEKIKKDYENIKYSRRMENVKSVEGRVPAEQVSNSNIFCRRMAEFSDTYEHIYLKVIKYAKEINDKSQELSGRFNYL